VIAGFGTASGMRVAHNLILLCQWHHTAVHEGGMTIRKTEDGASWQFVMPDGGPHLRSCRVGPASRSISTNVSRPFSASNFRIKINKQHSPG
jgi:hypothetical protein